jgi:hypothetical protein
LFHPALADTRLLRTIIFSFTDAIENEKIRHYNSVMNYIWRVVTRYVQQVAYEKLTCEEIIDEESVHEIVPQSAHKRAKYDDPTLALLETMVEMSHNPSSRLREEAFTPQEVAAKELHYYQNIDRSEWPKFDEILTWWRSVKIQQNLPCLSQVAQAFLGCLPSSGGLECDFGHLKEIISPRRAALGQGFVEIKMMMKLNKHLFLSNPDQIKKLSDKEWREEIPKRPTFNFDSDDGESGDEGDTEIPNGDDDIIITEESQEDAVENVNTDNDEESQSDVVLVEGTPNSEDGRTGDWMADEYSWVIGPNQATVTDTLLSNHRVFDSQETTDGNL